MRWQRAQADQRGAVVTPGRALSSAASPLPPTPPANRRPVPFSWASLSSRWPFVKHEPLCQGPSCPGEQRLPPMPVFRAPRGGGGGAVSWRDLCREQGHGASEDLVCGAPPPNTPQSLGPAPLQPRACFPTAPGRAGQSRVLTSRWTRPVSAVGYGSWFEHVQEFWEHRTDANVLFLKYEDMHRVSGRRGPAGGGRRGPCPPRGRPGVPESPRPQCAQTWPPGPPGKPRSQEVPAYRCG